MGLSTVQKDYIKINGVSYGITDVVYVDDIYDEGNIIGTAIAKSLSFSIYNMEINFEEKEVEYITVDKDGNSYNMGKFIVTNVVEKKLENKQEVDCYDYMIKFDKEYNSTLDYKSNNVTIRDVLVEACTKCGVELADNTFANSTFIVDSNQFDGGATYRHVIKAVASISGRSAKVMKDNKLHLISFKSKEPKYTIYGNSYYDINGKRNTHAINTVVIGMSDIESENITKKTREDLTDINAIKILDNPFAYTQQKRLELIEALYNEVIGMSYQSFEIKAMGNPSYNIGDRILISNGSDTNINTYILRYIFKSPELLESKYSAPSITKSTVIIANPPSIESKLRRTEIIVNKELQKISSEVKSVVDKGDEQLSKISKLENDVNSFNYSISTIGGENLLKNSIMLDMENNVPKSWSVDDGGTIETEVDPHASEKGAVTGSVFILNGKKIRQKIMVKKHTDINRAYYSFSTKIYKGYIGGCYIKLYNDFEEHKIEIPDSTNSDYNEYTIERLAPKSDHYIIEFYSEPGTNTKFTDNMFVLSESKQSWKQASGESNARMVNITNDGLTLKTDKQEEYYKLTNVGITGYGKENNQVIEKTIINNEKIAGNRLESKQGLKIPPLQIVPIFNEANRGWAIVETNSEE